ncbi:MAG: flippase-like domain-containing protein, partial [Planctomycetes bacterium]|nr:flippase-like domain-containing protein [Planctomycetota bacterium]
MTRKTVVNLLKLLLVAGLVTFVFFKIELTDRIITFDATGKQTSVIEGAIVGPWDASVVEFRSPDGAVTAHEIGVPSADGTTVQVSAGFWTVVKNLDLLLFAAGAACYLFSLVFSSIRWWWLLRVNRVECSIVDSIRFTWIGVFFNNVVPGQTGGDVVKALYIMRHAGDSGRVAAVVSVLVDRVLGLASLALLGAVVVLFFLDEFPEVAIGVWSVLAGVSLLGVVAFSKRIRRMIRLDALLKNLP